MREALGVFCVFVFQGIDNCLLHVFLSVEDIGTALWLTVQQSAAEVVILFFAGAFRCLHLLRAGCFILDVECAVALVLSDEVCRAAHCRIQCVAYGKAVVACRDARYVVGSQPQRRMRSL